MLETPEERIKLLRAGFTGETIERLYIESNNFKIVRTPLLVELVGFDSLQNKEICINCEMEFECEQSFCEEGTPLC